ncbi:MAG: TolB family protein, partial [Rubrobacteraceae bacterium]
MTKTSHPRVWITLALATALAVAASLLAMPTQAAFPGKDGKIAFAMDDGNDDEIFTMNPDGTGLKQLTDNDASDDDPSFSPDGRRIVFESNRDDPNEDDIFVMKADGS